MADSQQANTQNPEMMSLEKWVKTPRVQNALRSHGFVEYVVIGTSVEENARDTEGRLRDLGFIAGACGRFLSQAPFGEPIYTEISDTIVALRAGEACLIQVSDMTVNPQTVKT